MYQLGVPVLEAEMALGKPAHIDGLVDRSHYDQLLVVDPAKAAELL